jgi:hypothetical protein
MRPGTEATLTSRSDRRAVLNRDEYARAMHAFLDQMSAGSIGGSRTTLQYLLGLEVELREAARESPGRNHTFAHHPI